MAETNATKKVYADEIDLSVIFAVLWKRKYLIIFGTLALTLIAAIYCFFIPKVYYGEGVYQLGNPKIVRINNKETTEKNTEFVGVPILFYKKSSPQFLNPDRLQLFAGQEKGFSVKDLKDIKVNFQTAADINQWIKPVVAEVNSVIGLNLSYEADSPQKAYAYIRFFGKYVRDCLLYVSLYDYVMNEYNNAISGLNQNENDTMDLKFKLMQNSKKMLEIKAILTKYPESAKIENRQFVLIQEGGARFLAPITQLVGIESALADLRQQLAELERGKEKLVIRKEFFLHCNDEFNKLGRTGEMMFAQLKAIKSEVFKNKDFSRDTVKEVSNRLSLDLQAFDLAFYTNSRFISGPTTSVKLIKPKKSVIVILACVLSVFFFMFLAFFLSWWQNHKQAILSDAPKS